MTGHGLSHFELAAVLQVIGDARRAEAVGADFGAYAGVERPALDSRMDIGLGQRLGRVRQPAMTQGREQRRIRRFSQAGRRNPFL